MGKVAAINQANDVGGELGWHGDLLGQIIRLHFTKT
jgi:hypothetical protein